MLGRPTQPLNHKGKHTSRLPEFERIEGTFKEGNRRYLVLNFSRTASMGHRITAAPVSHRRAIIVTQHGHPKGPDTPSPPADCSKMATS